jgi:hypothetical protein
MAIRLTQKNVKRKKKKKRKFRLRSTLKALILKRRRLKMVRQDMACEIMCPLLK